LLDVAARHVNRSAFYNGAFITIMDASLNLTTINLASENGLETTNSEWAPCTTPNIKIQQ
jgi:hypothetical protein